MTREQLEHAIRAVCDLTNDSEVYVFGSQAILGTYPDAPGALLVSEEVDLSLKNFPRKTDVIDGALGQDSTFHHAFGFYVHGLPIHEAAMLPPGWEERAVAVRNANTRDNTGWCIEAHDLASSKLYAFRDKDREFVQLLIVHRLIDAFILEKRIKSLKADADRVAIMLTWLQALE